jgi:hypothetical protein
MGRGLPGASTPEVSGTVEDYTWATFSIEIEPTYNCRGSHKDTAHENKGIARLDWQLLLPVSLPINRMPCVWKEAGKQQGTTESGAADAEVPHERWSFYCTK